MAKLNVIALGQQRPAAEFEEILDAGPILARNEHTARQWLGRSGPELLTTNGLFEASPLADVIARLVETIEEAISVAGMATYLVPGAGIVGDITVASISAELDVEIIPGHLNFGRAMSGVQIIDSLALAIAEESSPFDAGQFALDPSITTVVTNLHGPRTVDMALRQLRKTFGDIHEPSDDGTLIVEPLTTPTESASFQKLEQIVSVLRSPDGCPWDRKQTIGSLLPQLYEELQEFKDAWQEQDSGEQAEELGDVLLHIIMIAQIARESGYYSMNDVIRSISAKMVRRHPHVFGDVEIESMEELHQIWNEVKRKERAAKANRHNQRGD